MTYAGRVKAAVVILPALACLASGLALQQAVGFLGRQKDSEVALYAGAVAPFMADIPKDVMVGYVSDMSVSGGPYDRGYFHARYVLSPVRLGWKRQDQWTIGCEYLVAFYMNGDDLQACMQREGYVLAKEGGQGAYLLRKRSR